MEITLLTSAGGSSLVTTGNRLGFDDSALNDSSVLHDPIALGICHPLFNLVTENKFFIFAQSSFIEC